jgi:2-polyprenyl-3-methyl-5-hydroxy-6-metoxy-1,4-benzoquinol methylase
MEKSLYIKNFYSKIQFPGHYTLNSLNYHNPIIRNPYLKLIDSWLTNGTQVLDVGCGTGLISNLFAMKYKKLTFTGIDFSNSIDYAHDFSVQHGISNVKFLKEDFLNFTTDKKYNIIICQGVLHHIPEYNLALSKLKSLLLPGGTIIIGLYHPWGKIIKKYVNINYQNEILRQDQECNVYETSFLIDEVKNMFFDFELTDQYPVYKGLLAKVKALTNYKNGGLITYVFKDVK